MTGGRWPANVILTPSMAEVLDEQSGITTSQSVNNSERSQATGATSFKGHKKERILYPSETGGASRFFLEAGYEPWELDWILANGLRPCGD